MDLSGCCWWSLQGCERFGIFPLENRATDSGCMAMVLVAAAPFLEDAMCQTTHVGAGTLGFTHSKRLLLRVVKKNVWKGRKKRSPTETFGFKIALWKSET